MGELKYYIKLKIKMLIRAVLFLMFFIIGTSVNAQIESFKITVQNIVQTGPNTLVFDVYLLNEDPSRDFELANVQLGFLLNSLIYTGGKLAIKIDNSRSDLESYQQFTSKPAVEENLGGYPGKTLIRLSPTPNITRQGTIISRRSPGTLLTRFLITGSVNFTANSTPDLEFTSSSVTSPLYPTKVSEYLYFGTYKYKRQLNIIPGGNAIVYSNPILNPVSLPKVFDVTGTGSYCHGEGEGLPVGLNGSETGVKYTLFRNGIPVDPSVEGTGSVISFGIRPPGTYTVTGANIIGMINMNGSAIIVENPLPEIPVSSVDCRLGFGKAIVNVTSPLGVGFEYRLDGGIYQSAPSFTGVANGNHTITVKNSFGCIVTGLPFNVDCGCANPPSLTLGNNSGSTCGTEIVTVSNNRFGGSATSVTITENGGGAVVPVSTNSTPFDFVYLPAESDIGKTIIITVTTDNPNGSPCEEASATYTLTVNNIPPAPLTGNIVQPTCVLSTGSVVISGLPLTGIWELIRSPDNIITSGTGPGLTVTGLNPGTYTFKVRNSNGCISGSSANVIINPQPQKPPAPVPGTITQPSCEDPTGSVVLNGLPSEGIWTVNGNPGGIIKSGTGINTTISNLIPNSYTFTVTNAEGCTSEPSSAVVIHNPPEIPAAPVIGKITPPTCTVATGAVILSGLPATGTWTLTRYPGAVKINGSGTTRNVTGLQPGTFYFTVTSSSGCTSPQSGNVIIPAQPPVPSVPGIGQITQPTYTVPTGSVVITGLPEGITWKLVRNPGEIVITGTGTSFTVSELQPGVYTFAVINTHNCISPYTPEVVINEQPQPLNLVVHDPPTICSTSTADLTDPSITEGSDNRLTLTYWADRNATVPLLNPSAVSEGIYYIKGTLAVAGSIDFYVIEQVNVTADQMPAADAGPDQVLVYTFETEMNALPVEYGIGEWSVSSGNGTFKNASDPESAVTNLSFGRNDFVWSVTNGVCPAATDNVIIIVEDLVIPSLITPDMDGKNDYFILRGLEILGKTELVIFDRRGAKIYWNNNYDNTWNGVDHKGNPLPNDTYFYVLKAESGKSMSGFVVLRK